MEFSRKEILDAIKKQFENGESIAEIRNSLILMCIDENEADSIISELIEHESQNREKQNTWWVYPVLLLVLIVFAFFVFRTVNPHNDNGGNAPQNIHEALTAIDCGSNFDCFINASSRCRRSTLLFSNSIDLFGMNISATNRYDVLGEENNSCVLEVTTINETISFTQEAIASMKSRGMTDEQIEEQLKLANNQTSMVRGMKTTCRLNSGLELSEFLEKIRSMNATSGVRCTPDGCEMTGDWADANCTIEK